MGKSPSLLMRVTRCMMMALRGTCISSDQLFVLRTGDISEVINRVQCGEIRHIWQAYQAVLPAAKQSRITVKRRKLAAWLPVDTD